MNQNIINMQHKYLFITIILIVIVSFFNCKTKKVNEKNMNNQEINAGSNKEVTEEIFNADKTKLLILKYELIKNPIIKYSYQVMDVKSNKELKKGVFAGEKIEWLDNNTLRCRPYVGMVKANNDIDEINYIIIKVDSI